MDTFSRIINAVNNIIWSNALVIVLVSVGIFFTILTKGAQFRLFKQMFVHMFEKDASSAKIKLTPYQAFATTVGCRVGTGNIAGVATAIYFGGPGAVVWMWITALFGAASSLIESLLGSAYKDRYDNEICGGPSYYMEKGLRCKPLGVLYAIAVLVGPVFMMSALQTKTAVTSLSEAFGASQGVFTVIMAALVAAVVVGGLTRIGKVAELMAPIMCAVFMLIGIIITVLNIERLPGVISIMFRSAFSTDSVYGAIFGTMVQWGVKRGLYSNDAGNGMGPLVSSSADCAHPVKQGLVQALSVYVDTLLICSVTGFSILLAGTYNVSNAAGTGYITEGLPGVEYGILYMQSAMTQAMGSWGSVAMALIISIFVFSTLTAYGYQADVSLRYLCGKKKWTAWIGRPLLLLGILLGGIVDGEVVWAMGDTGAGIMAWINLLAIVLLSPVAVKILRDYDNQRKAGLNPIFDPETVGIKDPNGVWTEWVEKKRARGDYENEKLGYRSKAKG
ncbi:sodium:alanine symporter family protein [uncultured Oscillibacter sp.]|uniref:alanine/glycine:cation symporter family protein n=1 Tax=uncultured Oscillibacter sp. TaxID=876091 RepID=UPI0025DBDC1E|nr:alanine/glycine:cation symporter family protein [uncultured Oscillibacter sp.]